MKTIYDRIETPKAGYLYTRNAAPLYYETFRVSRELYRLLSETDEIDEKAFNTDDIKLVERNKYKYR